MFLRSPGGSVDTRDVTHRPAAPTGGPPIPARAEPDPVGDGVGESPEQIAARLERWLATSSGLEPRPVSAPLPPPAPKIRSDDMTPRARNWMSMPGESLLRLGILLGACIGTVAVCVARRWHVPFPAASATAAASWWRCRSAVRADRICAMSEGRERRWARAGQTRIEEDRIC